jgi:phospholipid transport system substrate-binding protein
MEMRRSKGMRLCIWLLFLLVGVGLSGLAGPALAAETETPTQLVQRLIQTIGSIKPSNNGHLSEAERARNAAAAHVINTILDVPSVSKRALGKYWQARSAAEQQEFIALLEELFAKVAFPKSSEFFSDYQITIANERITGERAVVRTTVTHPKEGLISIDYQLAKQNGSWRVRDILLDDVSLALNLRSQFHKIISEDSYAELLRRMREKLAE